jgi:transcriptional regulator of arginine metabolism
MNKTYRHGQILRLIRSKRVHTQEALAQELSSVGVQATQVTLSRDIRELGLVKTPEGYRQVEAVTAAGPAIETIMAEFLLEARPAQNLLVLKTSPGHANTLAIALDQEDWPEVVGTIAGDDTVLIIAPDNATALTLRARLLSYLES